MGVCYFYLSAVMNTRECFLQLFLVFRTDEERTGVLQTAEIQLPIDLSQDLTVF